jgi:hypothetical protein
METAEGAAGRLPLLPAVPSSMCCQALVASALLALGCCFGRGCSQEFCALEA